MKQRSIPRSARTGSALLLALLVLLILLAIMAQLVFGTKSDADVARNDITLTTMDLAIESVMMEEFDKLKTDGESGGSDSSGSPSDASGAANTGANPGASPAGGSAAAGAAGAGGSVDSHEDPWGRPQRTTINDIELRVFVQDEDSKFNLLGLLTANQQEADAAFERLVRILDLCREGTTADIDAAQARSMAQAIRDHLKERSRSLLPRAHLLSDDDQNKDVGLPLSLKEFAVLAPFDESMFRDYRDERGRIVHSIGSFVTVWTSLSGASSSSGSGSGAANGANGATASSSTASGADPNAGGANGSSANTNGSNDANAGAAAGSSAGSANGGTPTGGAGGSPQNGANGAAGGSNAAAKAGVAVNVNTAPPAVLKGLVDDRDVSGRFWDKVIEYRNLEEDDKDKQKSGSSSSSSGSSNSSGSSSDKEPEYDEYGNEIIQRKVFDSLDELRQVEGYDALQAIGQAELQKYLTTESQVFSIYVTARKSTGVDDNTRLQGRPVEQEDQQVNQLTHTVRCIVWRRKQGDTVTIVPLVRWETLDYVPLEVLDYPDEKQ